MKRESVRWTRGRAQRARGRVRASVQPINRSVWSSCNSSLGTPPLSHFTHHHHNTIIHHHHPLSIIECVSRLGIQD
ncbi:hypothetical protein HanXRQr2_Chr09g0383271 [Helianthus annuus]|uniref:Uncharacterized protein n=1 Tax=Helianthus annuus TaxID=4232 RepID=A0A9K3I5Y1_HELAN|nr:hypothetical protein HanXRQr2_Chr09g0383271 [Helianthus annuus]KAJ0892724.1 hypothetical protein HanPSC8_Chr09g0369351 [Helianthus annuus]